MKKYRALVAFLALLAIGATLGAFQVRAVAVTRYGLAPALSEPLQQAVLYLKEEYDPRIRLVRESPVTAPSKFWVATDNRLAALALEKADNENMAATLKQSADSYTIFPHGLIEVLEGKVVSWPPHIENRLLLKTDGSAEIWTEAKNGSVFEDWQQYSDLALYGALNELNAGNRQRALELYHSALEKFDGTGLADKAFEADHAYATFKVALALYAARALNQPEESLRKVLLSKQAAGGGFYALYDANGLPMNDTNTETTSLAILALAER